MEPFHFIQLADPQFGTYAHLSGLTEEEIAESLARGYKVQMAPKIEGSTGRPSCSKRQCPRPTGCALTSW